MQAVTTAATTGLMAAEAVCTYIRMAHLELSPTGQQQSASSSISTNGIRHNVIAATDADKH